MLGRLMIGDQVGSMVGAAAVAAAAADQPIPAWTHAEARWTGR